MTSREDWYFLSKTLAERLGNEFMQSLGPKEQAPFDLVCINPSFIFGPMLQSSLNESSEKIYNYVTGKVSTTPNFCRGYVDVRDVAEAHVLAYENKRSSGRYLLIGSGSYESEVCDAITSIRSDAKVPTIAPSESEFPRILFDASKARNELGIQFRSLPEMVAGTIHSLVEHNFI